MKTIIQKLLVVALIATNMSPIAAQKADTKSAKGQPAKSVISKGFSWKTKLYTALGIAGTAAIAYMIYKFQTRPDKDLEELYAFDMHNSPKTRVENGRAGRMLFDLQAQSENFQEAMRDPQRAQNIRALFNDPDFVELVNDPGAGVREALLRGEFNKPDIIQNSSDENFVQNMMNGIRHIMGIGN